MRTHDLAARLATVPGLVRPGISSWDMTTRLPLHPLSVENAYADPRLLHSLAKPGARFAHRLGADVVVGAETGGIPLAGAVSLAGGLPFAFVRKPGYVGHEAHEPRVRGAAVKGRRVLLVDDVIDGAQVRALVDATVARHGRVDGLVNNAGASLSGPLEDVDLVETVGCCSSTLSASSRRRRPCYR
ncbi:SDR family oxidoreductase [Amycolatopsis sp. NPDC051758]|uniref:SDR family oxidoreductase n=1 Tax=Amycolatopsis sp. NPDC051758 TaxID=3363935 RepID=UPI0037BAA422